MITAYVRENGAVKPIPVQGGDALRPEAVWIDLLAPTREEELLIEAALAIELPTREEMREIEISSRLYQENGAMFMTANVLTHVDAGNPETEPMTFILVGQRLVTIRYANPLPFRSFAVQVQRQPGLADTGDVALASLLDAIIDRVADVLERVQHDMNQVSKAIFRREKTDFEEALRKVGQAENLTSRSRESLLSIARVLSFLSRPSEVKPNKALGRALKTLSRDVMALADHCNFLGNNITFLLNAVLGLSSIEQTNIIKIFSVVAVIFLPPTLVASIYGMNFKYMPELEWPIGYPLSLVLMVLAGILPYVYFKRRGWL
jgi:magnesium transporter